VNDYAASGVDEIPKRDNSSPIDFDSMAGAGAESVAEHLGRSIELYPGFREMAEPK
jgi:hypothetical protein